MMHVIIGLFFIALGIWGVFDEWYYVVDFLKGSGSLFLIVAGMLAIFAGAVGPIGSKQDDDRDEPSPDEDGDDGERDEPAPEDANTEDD